jgi:hypothetical protein
MAVLVNSEESFWSCCIVLHTANANVSLVFLNDVLLLD